jgi:menaquinone-specific isochorismate synthase
VKAALRSFEEGSCEKVVLAREVVLSFDHPLDPAGLLAALRAATHSCCHFCFQPRADAAFIGASPEQLYRRTGRHIETEAIAGTRARGRTPAEDARLRNELMNSEKEQREQAYVARAVDAALGDLCMEHRGEAQPSVLSLAKTHHLITRFDGELRQGLSDADILKRLHPTPAVGGHPTGEALESIRRWEPFDRGWYAGPVGWYSRDAAQFAVGIRSALVRPGEARVYSGAGVVEGSTAEDEWEELENKIRDFTTLLVRP